MSELFPETVVKGPDEEPLNTKSKKSKKKPVLKLGTTDKTSRPGVCECGSGKFTPFLRESLWIRKCKNEACGKETVV